MHCCDHDSFSHIGVIDRYQVISTLHRFGNNTVKVSPLNDFANPLDKPDARDSCHLGIQKKEAALRVWSLSQFRHVPGPNTLTCHDHATLCTTTTSPAGISAIFSVMI